MRETESLEQNTKEKFVEFCKEYGLIVVGYSGSDRSIMDVLELLARQENYLKNGVYWCLRRSDNVCHSLRNLIWKDKVYPVLIDGFDELFAEIHAQTNCGELKLNSSKRQSKLHQTIQNITSDQHNLIKNPIIAHEISLIKNEDDSKDISEFVKQMVSANESSALKMTDVRNLMEIDSLIKSCEFQKAEEICSMYFDACARNEGKKVYIEKYIDIYQRLGQESKVSFWCDKLIDMDPNNIEYHFKKARSIGHIAERIEYLKEILERFPYSISLLNSISSNSIRLMRQDGSIGTKEFLKDALAHSEKSLSIDPSLDNGAWRIKMEGLSVRFFQCLDDNEKKDLHNQITEHVKFARSRHPEHRQALELAEDQLKIACKPADLKGLIGFLLDLADKSSIANRRKVKSIIARCFEHVYEIDEDAKLRADLKEFIERKLESDDKSYSISKCKIKYWLTYGGNKAAAMEEIEEILKHQSIGSHIADLLKLPMDFSIDLLDRMQEKLEFDRHSLYKSYYYETLSEICAFKGDYDASAQHIESALKEGLALKTYLSTKTYLLLLSKNYHSILSLASRYESKLSEFDAETIVINVQCAAQKVSSKQYNELVLRNLIAQSKSESVIICAHALLGHEVDVKRLIAKTLDKDPGLIYQYKRWPVLSAEYLPGESKDESVA